MHPLIDATIPAFECAIRAKRWPALPLSMTLLFDALSNLLFSLPLRTCLAVRPALNGTSLSDYKLVGTLQSAGLRSPFFMDLFAQKSVD